MEKRGRDGMEAAPTVPKRRRSGGRRRAPAGWGREGERAPPPLHRDGEERESWHGEGRRGTVTSSSSSSAAPTDGADDPAGGAVDRLSELPETVRFRILSLLPLEDAVRTDLVSKSWRGLWKRRLHDTSSLDFTIPRDGTTTSQFVDAAKRLLAERQPPLRLEFLRIVFTPRREDIPFIRRLLEYASDHGVAFVHIDLSPTNRAATSNSVASDWMLLRFDERVGGSMIRLSLRWCHFAPKSSDLSSLERLYLHGVSMTKRMSLSKLIQSCPLLRFLDVRCSPELSSISAPKSELTTLTIVDCPNPYASIVVRLRSIQSLRICSISSLDLQIENPAPLEDAYLSWGASGLCWAMNLEAWDRIARTTLQHVRTLTLGGIPFERIRRLKGIQFINLRELQLLFTVEGYCNACYIYEFFNRFRCPRLERLFIQLQLPANSICQLDNADRSATFSKVALKKLRIIKITNYGDSSFEQQLVTSLLLNTVNLQSMILIAQPVEEAGLMNNGRAEYATYLQLLLKSQPRASYKASMLAYEFDQSGVQPIHFNVDQEI